MQRLFPNFLQHPAAETAIALRKEVREFLAQEEAQGTWRTGMQSWPTFNRAFSQRCAAHGYIAMTWPKKFGGHERSPFERYVVNEELLAAGAPLGSHWIADRQSGPQIIRYGSERLKANILPLIAAGQCTFGIGMSEPDSGSDLSSIKTRANRVEGGYSITGRKVWTTNGQHADFLIALCRTAPLTADRYAGLSQLVVPLKQEGVSIKSFATLTGEKELNEITFDNVFVPDDHLLGKGGDGWSLVTEELAFERSGPDRFLSTFGLLSLLVDAVGRNPDRLAAMEIGRIVAQLASLRHLSLQVNSMLAEGEKVSGLATITKDLGTSIEQSIPELARRLIVIDPSPGGEGISGSLAFAILGSPCFSLRGGTREILKGIIARELGLR